MTTTQDTRNQYNNTDIKWIIAQSTNNNEWEIKYLGSGQTAPNLMTDDGYIHPIIDNSPAYERDASEFAIFRNTQNWWTKKPRRLVDFRDKSNHPIGANFSFINELDSSWF